MSVAVSLRAVVDALESSGAEWAYYLGPESGEILLVSDEDRRAVEEGDELLLPEWERAILPRVREVLSSDRFLRLPGRFEIHEWAILQEFALQQPPGPPRDELLDSIHGRGGLPAPSGRGRASGPGRGMAPVPRRRPGGHREGLVGGQRHPLRVSGARRHRRSAAAGGGRLLRTSGCA